MTQKSSSGTQGLTLRGGLVELDLSLIQLMQNFGKEKCWTSSVLDGFCAGRVLCWICSVLDEFCTERVLCWICSVLGLFCSLVLKAIAVLVL